MPVLPMHFRAARFFGCSSRKVDRVRMGPHVGQSGYITPAVWRVPEASQRWGKSEWAHTWAKVAT